MDDDVDPSSEDLWNWKYYLILLHIPNLVVIEGD